MLDIGQAARALLSLSSSIEEGGGEESIQEQGERMTPFGSAEKRGDGWISTLALIPAFSPRRR